MNVCQTSNAELSRIITQPDQPWPRPDVYREVKFPPTPPKKRERRIDGKRWRK